jgi:hypothetical protein
LFGGVVSTVEALWIITGIAAVLLIERSVLSVLDCGLSATRESEQQRCGGSLQRAATQ